MGTYLLREESPVPLCVRQPKTKPICTLSGGGSVTRFSPEKLGWRRVADRSARIPGARCASGMETWSLASPLMFVNNHVPGHASDFGCKGRLLPAVGPALQGHRLLPSGHQQASVRWSRTLCRPSKTRTAAANPAAIPQALLPRRRQRVECPHLPSRV